MSGLVGKSKELSCSEDCVSVKMMDGVCDEETGDQVCSFCLFVIKNMSPIMMK